MIIAQLTDLHIGFDGEDSPCKNSARLRQVLAEIKAMTVQPDLLLLTGDLVELGANWAYERLKAELADVDIPVYFAMGNHDDRKTFAEVFPEAEFNEGFLQYVIDDGGLRVIVLDSLKIGKHGGGFCEARAKWLEARLSEAPDRPTLIALHHPPIETGIGWMTARDDAGWVQRLKAVVSKHDNIVQIISGHIHCCMTKAFAGTMVSVSRAIAPQVKLDLTPIEVDAPDGRVLLVDTDAGFCLHHWDGKNLTTHNGLAPDGRPIIHYDEKHAFVVRHTLDLPPKA